MHVKSKLPKGNLTLLEILELDLTKEKVVVPYKHVKVVHDIFVSRRHSPHPSKLVFDVGSLILSVMCLKFNIYGKTCRDLARLMVWSGDSCYKGAHQQHLQTPILIPVGSLRK